jgi:NAD(P)-dependent dehydrogenase (short-subunit alcohol dehydrogenase family)/acyl dehydratase
LSGAFAVRYTYVSSMAIHSVSTDDATLRFSAADVDLFASASHDLNPLHVSAAYARRTAFGTRVAHGMLGVLACLGRLSVTPSTRLASVRVAFRAPIRLDVAYTTEVRETDSSSTVELRDGRRVILKLTASFTGSGDASSAPRSGTAPRTEAARWGVQELAPGSERRGDYGPRADTVDDLFRRWHVGPHSPTGAYPSTVLIALSYLVGMEAPGEAALFANADVRFNAHVPAQDGVLAYHLTVREHDPRFDLVAMGVVFSVAGVTIAEATVDAFVRPGPAALDADLLRTLLPRSTALSGRSAIVVGGSRGLGAAIALALADQQCKVGLCFAHSRESARAVAALATGGEVELLQADAGDATEFELATRDFRARNRGLDFLVCSACPPLSAMSLDLASLSRFADYVSQSLALAAVPLATTLETLEATRGTVVLISSMAIVTPTREWPHYTTAKAALEGLLRAALTTVRNVRTVVVRPPRLATDLVNTPGSSQESLAPEIVAARIVSHLTNPSAEALSILDDF